ncbi:MAG: SAM-dependent methyltransferase [Roseivirga sp.]|jgi:SAM-dependent methyltransferase
MHIYIEKLFGNSIHTNAKVFVLLDKIGLKFLSRLIFRYITSKNRRKYRHQKKRKLELGPGENRIPGFETMNVYFGPNVDYILDITEKLPFDDDTFEIIYASHIFEHIPWYKINEVLTECFRILNHGGVLEIWVPDGFKICNALIKYENTGEDDSKLDGWYRLNPEQDPHLWASGRIFSYGDGTGNINNPNWHRTLFTPKLLRKLLKKNGFDNITKMDSKEVRATDHGWINLGIKARKQ